MGDPALSLPFPPTCLMISILKVPSWSETSGVAFKSLWELGRVRTGREAKIGPLPADSIPLSSLPRNPIPHFCSYPSISTQSHGHMRLRKRRRTLVVYLGWQSKVLVLRRKESWVLGKCSRVCHYINMLSGMMAQNTSVSTHESPLPLGTLGSRVGGESEGRESVCILPYSRLYCWIFLSQEHVLLLQLW